MLVLPTGQIMLTDASNDIEIYTPQPSSSNSQWAPIVLSTPLLLSRGGSSKIAGVRFNGMSPGRSVRRRRAGSNQFSIGPHHQLGNAPRVL
jgi:hypothetical protein